MRRSSVLLLSLLLAIPGLVEGQTPYPECNDPLIVGQQNINVCNAALDGAEIFHPVAGLLVSGGNPVLGGIGTLGGFPHFALTLRVNATQLKTPDLNYDGTGTTVAAGDEIFAPAPLVEAAVGILPGFGPAGFLSLDVLGSAQLLPTNAVDNLTVDKNARSIGDIALGLGFGARVGVLKGRAIIPAVTVSAMYRSIPRITFGDVSGGDNYSFSTNLSATNLRAVAGYKLALLAVGAGLGWDKYTSDARITFQDQTVPTATLRVERNLDNTRTMAFLTAALDLPILNIGAEIGYQFGKDENLKTDFSGNNPGDNRLFAGAGLRFTF
jgi:hypothetical protein